MNKKVLVVYYSYTGNTKKIAERISKKLGADMAEIIPTVPYSEEYDFVVKQGQEEINNGFQPEIKKIEKNIEEYDSIVLGTPVWWYTYAPAVNSFLSQYSFDNKTIIPFITNGGWIGHTIQDIQKKCPNAKIEKAINIEFSEKELATPIQEIDTWIENLK